MKPFEIVNREPRIPIVANIPHSSPFVPQARRGALLLSDEELEREHRAIVDWFTDDLFHPIIEAGGTALISRVSRLVVDTERFEDDRCEPMAARGMGVVYERTTQQGCLRHTPSVAERVALLEMYYRPYHAALTQLCVEVLERFGRCILLDCHSFPEHSLPYEVDRTLFRPEVCVGTDTQHSPEPLVGIMETVSSRFGWSCARNTPFKGTIVPLALYGDRRLSSVMIEFNRALYMEEATTERSGGFLSVQGWVRAAIEELRRYLACPPE